MRTLRLLVLTMVLAALPAAQAPAAPAVQGVFDLPGVQTNGQLAVGPDNNVWVALDEAIGRVRPDGGTTVLATGDLGNTLAFPTGGITSADGFIWVSQSPSAGKKSIVKIPPGAPSSASGVTVTGIDAGATAMTTGPDGNIWVGQPGKLVKFPPGDPTDETSYTIPGLAPKAITSASDGTLWVTDTANGGQVVNVTTAGVFTPHVVGGQPQFLAGGPGGQVVYGNPNNSPQQIGRLLAGGLPQTIDRPNGSDPFGVAFGADGAYWIAEFAGNRLARLTTDGQLTTLGGLPVAPGLGPRQLTAAPGNTLWVTLDKPGDGPQSKIARVTGVDPPPSEPTPTPTPGGTPAGGGTPSGGGGTPADTTAPAVSAVTLSKTRITAGTRSVVLRFTLSEAGTARLVLSRRAAGRRRGTSCVQPTPKLRRAKRCTRLARVRTITSAGKAGANAITIATARLAPGGYGAELSVADAAGNRAAPLTRTFTVAAKPRRR